MFLTGLKDIDKKTALLKVDLPESNRIFSFPYVPQKYNYPE